MKPMKKRILSLFLSMLMVLGCLPLTAGAASSQTIYYESSNIRYGTAFSFKNPYGDGFPGGTHNWNSTTHVSYIHVGNGVGYCIQPGIRIGDGPGDKVEYAGGSDSSYYKKFPAALRRALGLVSLYGYPNAMTDKNAYYATQVLIWGLVIGQVDPNDFTGTNKFYTCLDEDSKKAVKPYYESLLNQLKFHETRPSFAGASSSQAKPITLQWDSGSKRYEATVTDSNEVLSQFDFTASGLTISRKGNQLTLSSTQPVLNPISVSSDKVMPEVKVGSQLVWTSNEYMQQEVLSGAPVPSPVTAWLKVQTEKTGTIALKKTSEDGKVSGVKFQITGNGISKTVTTGKDGSVDVTGLPAGTYTVSEVEIPGYYETPESQTVKLTAGQTASVSFSNTLKKGSLTVVKTAEDGFKEGFTFRLTGTADSGEKIDLTAVTGKDGKAVFQNVPIGSGYVLSEEKTPDRYVVPEDQTADIEWNKVTNKEVYNALKDGQLIVTKTAEDGFKEGFTFRLTGTADSGEKIDLTAVTGKDGKAVFQNVPVGSGYVLSEENTPDRYVVPEDQTVDIEWNKVTNKSFTNTLKKFRVQLHKSDSETGTPQGDAVLDGAQYTLYNQQDKELETLTITDGTAVSGYYPCQTIAIRETKAPVGYQLDDTVYTVEAPADEQTEEHITLTREVKEQVIKGKIAIRKYLAQAGSEEKLPMEGIEFTITLNSDPNIKEVITTNAEGDAETGLLPYGVYTVTETEYPESVTPIEPFTVTISEHHKTYEFVLDNMEKSAQLKIVKADADTGKTIPLEGAGFRIKDLTSGKWVSQNGVDEFFTTQDGTLMLPKVLPYGSYELYETVPPVGYLLYDKPIPFTIDGSQQVVTVTCHDTAVKGEIQVEKIGERFTAVKQEETPYGTQYTPVFTKTGLPDVEFTVTAAENICAADGTVLLKKGQTAGVMITGKDGKATLSDLPLGADGTARYLITETGAPDDHLTAEPVEVTLSYQDGHTPVVTASADIVDTRKKVQITLRKELEQDEKFEIGAGAESRHVVFGLFAEKDIFSADGSRKILAGSLIAYTGIDENGNAAFPADVPAGAYYVQELATDDQYILDGRKYPVVFTYEGQDTETVTIDAGNGNMLKNTLKRGKISGWKVDQDGFELGGAIIGLFREDAGEFTEETALMVTESNEIGYFEFANVPYGRYIVKEIQSPTGFLLSEDTFPVEIKEDGQVIEITIENQIIKGTVETIKVDADYPDHKLSGAVFEIYADVDHDGKFNADIDRLAGEMTETDPGLYQMKDLVYGNYFLHEKEAPEFFEKDDGYYPFYITKNGEVVRIETEAGVGFLNQAQTGSLNVVKTADDDKIKGRIFKITGTDFMGNAYEQEFTTDENGEIHVTLRVGKYTVSEVAGEDAEKYILPDDQTVEIQAGETTTVKMHNRLVPEVPSVPQTGDNPWRPVVVGVLAAIAALTGGVLIVLQCSLKSKNNAGR